MKPSPPADPAPALNVPRRDLRTAALLALALLVSSLVFVSEGQARASSQDAPDTGGYTPQVTTNVRGDALAYWTSRVGGRISLRTSSRSVDGPWRPADTVVEMPERQADADLEPRFVSIVVDQTGASHVLWASFARDPQRGEDEYLPAGFAVSSATAGASWGTAHLLAEASSATEVRDPQIAVSTDGRLVAVWRSGPSRASGQSPVLLTTLQMAERTRDGTWSEPRSLGSAGGYRAPMIAFGPAGHATVLWTIYGEGLLGAGPLVMANRTPAGDWTGLQRVSGLQDGLYGALGPLVDAAGNTTFLALRDGPYGIGGLVLQRIAAGASVAVVETVPRASARQRLNGYLGGAAYVSSPSMVIDRQGQAVVAFRSPGPDVEEGGTGISMLWAATRAAGGRWNVRPIDPMGEGNDDDAPVLDLRSDGRLTVTWSATSRTGTACRPLLFRSTRGDDGRWSPRVLVGEGPMQRTNCSFAIGVTAGDRSTLLTSAGLSGLLPSVDGRAPAASRASIPERFVTTWSAVRDEGGLRVPCRTRVDGHCSIALARTRYRLTRDRARATSLLSRTLECFPFRATGPVRAGARSLLVLANTSGDCDDWVPPTATFRATATFDALGRTSVSRQVRITIRR